MQRSALIVSYRSDLQSRSNAGELQARRAEAQLGIRVRNVFHDSDEGSLAKALSFLTLGRVDEVVAVPLFFSPGRIPDADVPRMLGLEEGATSGTVSVESKRVKVRMGWPFGNDPLMRGVIGTVLARENASEGTAVMLIGRGSMDGKDAATVEFNAGIVREYGLDAFTCFNDTSKPTVEGTLERVLSEGYKDVLAIPMYVSPDAQTQVEIPRRLGLEAGSREMLIYREGGPARLKYASEIGLEPGIADIVCRMIAS